MATPFSNPPKQYCVFAINTHYCWFITVISLNWLILAAFYMLYWTKHNQCVGLQLGIKGVTHLICSLFYIFQHRHAHAWAADLSGFRRPTLNWVEALEEATAKPRPIPSVTAIVQCSDGWNQHLNRVRGWTLMTGPAVTYGFGYRIDRQASTYHLVIAYCAASLLNYTEQPLAESSCSHIWRRKTPAQPVDVPEKSQLASCWSVLANVLL